MGRLVLFLVGFFTGVASLPAQDPGGSPIRTLAQIGYGPALLVGVGTYDQNGSAFGRLPGIDKDLEAMEATVRKLGWTTVTVLRDPTLDRLREAVEAFGPAARASSGASFFYFSGHGVLQNGLNYMIPANARVRTRGHLELYALPLEHLLGYLGQEGSGPALAFVDACRNNTLPSDGKNATSDLLLSRRPGMFLGFATAKDSTANASDSGSLYTRSLAERLLLPGYSLDDLYGFIIHDVEQASKAGNVEIQPPEKQSGLRLVLHLVPGGESPEVKRLREEVAALRRMRPADPSISTPMTTPPTPAQPPSGPFTNSLGMKFVPVPGTKVLMSVWETRVRDYRAFRKETGGEEDHPVVAVSWEDARAFAEWLGRKEGKTYRLPTDHEWSVAVGIGDRESATARPEEKDGEIEGVYPWGTQWPPPQGAGNYDLSLACDRFDETAPVGSFAPNRLGLYDLGGNVWEWCEDLYASSTTYRVLRGGSWGGIAEYGLRSSRRNFVNPTSRLDYYGFRLVLEVASGG